ncbi:MAG: prepilin-type N-terminal cleavage/methylation domain-containing protein, partial [Candidatus Micrarchaeota archaeon]|nr:prepilin-type N-terminal cleavage/methylation domain-containing protein [Candidatus Micrarchaeota archaeon]
SFTLIELLIVIAIIGILASVVVLILNPSQLLSQSRDSRRIQDLSNVNNAIGIYLSEGNTSMGSGNTVYVSIPDSSSTCGSPTGSDLSLPTIPGGWSYHCVSTTSLRNTDGTGWIPVNFTQISTGSPIPVLPVDPVDSKDYYYAYAVGTSSVYEITSSFESDKYQSRAAGSGNTDPTTYAVGNNLSLTPFIHGLVGAWNFNDASGGLNSTTADLSGWENNGTLLDATSTGTGPTYTTSGCLSGGCLSFDGADDFVRVLNNVSINPNASNFTVNVWFYANSVSAGILYNKENLYEAEVSSECGQNGCYAWQPNWAWDGQNFNATTGVWTMMTIVYDHSNQYLYKNGALVYSRSQTGNMGSDTNNLTFAARSDGASVFYNGLLDDVSMYDTALTPSQVRAIYNAEKTQ